MYSTRTRSKISQIKDLEPSKTAGLPPGTLVHVGIARDEKVKITIVDYDETHVEEMEVKTVEECLPFMDKPTITWINIDGIHDLEIIEAIGRYFGIHPLVLEDIVNTSQRPKMEDYADYLFVVLKMVYYDEKEDDIKIEQVSLILGRNLVISFQEQKGTVFDPISERIRSNKGRIGKLGADYLAYALIDNIVDNYFMVLDRVNDKIEGIEDDLADDPTPETLQSIHKMRREMIFIRKSIWPLRDVIGGLEKGESNLIQESTRIYLRDVYDHTIQVMDTIETAHDILSEMLDIYLSSLNNRMNEVIKMLTIIATIFIPLTFIAGVYGMNFQNMPELGWRWGYFVILAVMAAIGISMVVYFRRKKWL